VNRPGCFAEFIALPMTNIWRHDPDVNRDVAAIFDPFGNAVHTALTFNVLGERSEEHTSELQSRFDLVCRLLLEKKKKKTHSTRHSRNHPRAPSRSTPAT